MPAKKQRKNPSALKALRKSVKTRLQNLAVKSRLKTAVGKARTAIRAGDPAIATALTKEACRLIDKAASKQVIHARAAARRKSRLLHAHNQVFAPSAPQPEEAG